MKICDFLLYDPRSLTRGCVKFGPGAVSAAEGPDFARPPMGSVTPLATRQPLSGPSDASRIVRQSGWHGTRRRGSGCCCLRPIRHGSEGRCDQVRSPRGQSRRRRNRGRGALPLIDAGAAPCLGVPEVVQPLRNACNEKRPEAGKPRAQLASLHFGNIYSRAMPPSMLNCIFIFESQFVRSTGRRTILSANCPC